MTMITDVQTATGTSPYVEKKADVLGRDDFVTMFLAQLKNQDPLNPMDNKDMSAQLAQFSSLEQLFNVNTNLSALTDIQNQNTELLSLGYIGKEIVAEGDKLWLMEGKSCRGSFTLANQAECEMVITDQKGKLVRSVDMKTLSAGEHSFSWNGKNDAQQTMPPGAYKFTIVAQNAKGELEKVSTRTIGQVTKVQFNDNKPFLYVGNIPFMLEQVISIKAPAADTES
ncbi:MAG: flagellar hook assembly protein FlgD [Desulfobacteraceae bacterium]|nr:MAG: flagellar hook assembly protein FlgD [Desulfobacteraceae bacterium]